MAQNSILLDKALKFAARIVKLHKYLTKEKHETIISKQIIRSAIRSTYSKFRQEFIALKKQNH